MFPMERLNWLDRVGSPLGFPLIAPPSDLDRLETPPLHRHICFLLSPCLHDFNDDDHVDLLMSITGVLIS